MDRWDGRTGAGRTPGSARGLANPVRTAFVRWNRAANEWNGALVGIPAGSGRRRRRWYPVFALKLAYLDLQDALRGGRAALRARLGGKRVIEGAERHLRLCAEFPGAPGCA